VSIYVSQRPPTTLSDLERQLPYDLALVSVGFEARSSSIPLALAPPVLGIGLTFPDRHEAAYAENVSAITARGYELWEPASNAQIMVDELSSRFERAGARRKLDDNTPLRVAVDISSMTRARIAAIVQVAYALPPTEPIIIDLLYAPAAYRPSAPPLASWVSEKPVTEHFAGWDPDADKELLAVVGLGFEPNAAEGVIDYLTPDESLMFVPDGRDPQYRNDVERVNAEVLRKADITLDYAVEDPYRLILDLERLLLSRADERRLLLVPLGPKIFAVACLIVAARLYPMISVWRFSAGTNERARPATAAGWVCGLRLSTRPEATPGFSAITDTTA
jgi:hypothetical protein